ncbi:Ubiquitin-conjugating enzyme E2 Z [Geodia barretti]|uniref:Ubiquitin-conjugating enzyme E2 Z n=1 Tax=Geodia barretti TaxID=519541 RepID=A0AA35XGT1_GEOBA|nr:Ubiquitin-conjugating enzyme E2 Z [Geodia barretti]
MGRSTLEKPFTESKGRVSYYHRCVALFLHCHILLNRDLDTIYKDPPHGICVIPDKDNITTVHAMITGPFETPYEGGLFHFFVRFPPNYPFSPPRVKFLTTGGGTVRFNPNLYQNGKVCLSILGTWSGPGWTATQSLLSVLVSIQSLLNDKPYHNEPGYNQAHNPGDVEKYNDIIVHETLRVAVCDSLTGSQAGPPELQDVKREVFLGFADYYITTAKEIGTRLEGQLMTDPFNCNKGTFRFAELVGRLQRLQQSLAKQNSHRTS